MFNYIEYWVGFLKWLNHIGIQKAVLVFTILYFPIVVGAQIEFRGYVNCSYGDKDCSPCSFDPVGQFCSPTFSINDKFSEYSLRSGRKNKVSVKKHIQGMVRLADFHRREQQISRVVIFDDMPWAKELPSETGGTTTGKEGATYYDRSFVEPRWRGAAEVDIDGVFGISVYEPRFRLDIRNEYDHPGGGQAHGQTAVVAVSKGMANEAPGAVYFLHFPPYGSASIINSLYLNGRNGEMGGQKVSPQSVGFLKLASGHYLLVLAANRMIWLYTSDRETIENETRWVFAGRWTPECYKNSGGRLDECWGGANNMGLLTSCTGEIYMVTLNGTDGGFGSGLDYQWIQVYRLDMPFRQHITADLVFFERKNLGLSILNEPGFRFGGTVYISESGGISISNSERRTKVRTQGLIDGNNYITERLALTPCDTNPALFWDKNMHGFRYSLWQDLSNPENFKNKTSSLCVPSGWTIQVFSKKDFNGKSLTIVGPTVYRNLKRDKLDERNWANDIASVRIRRRPY